jgi:hypothetical protein
LNGEKHAELYNLGLNLDRRVRCLLIYCAHCDLKVLRVERDNRDRAKPSSTAGSLYTFGGLHVIAEGAREFTAYRDGITQDRTYTWQCPRGHADSRKIERFLRAWPAVGGEVRAPRVLRLKLGVDV